MFVGSHIATLVHSVLLLTTAHSPEIKSGMFGFLFAPYPLPEAFDALFQVRTTPPLQGLYSTLL